MLVLRNHSTGSCSGTGLRTSAPHGSSSDPFEWKMHTVFQYYTLAETASCVRRRPCCTTRRCLRSVPTQHQSTSLTVSQSPRQITGCYIARRICLWPKPRKQGLVATEVEAKWLIQLWNDVSSVSPPSSSCGRLI